MPQRVVSKNLFDFRLNGVLDEDLRSYEENQPKPSGKYLEAMKMLSNKDDEIFVNAMRTIITADVNSKQHDPRYQKGVDDCVHTELKVSTTHDGDYDVTTFVHTPKYFMNRKSNISNAALIYAHGGGVVACSAEMFKPYLSNFAIECEVVVFNVDYRLAPETKCPNNTLDFYEVVKYIISNAEKLNIDPNKIAIAGESGGGYICFSTMVLMAQRNESSLVKLAMPYIPMISDYCFSDPLAMTKEEKADVFGLRRIWGSLIPSNFEEQKSDPLLFPSKASDEILSKMPPTIIWSAEFDMFLTETLRMANRMRACGRLLELVVLPGIKHASHLNPLLKCYRMGMDANKLAIKEYLLD